MFCLPWFHLPATFGEQHIRLAAQLLPEGGYSPAGPEEGSKVTRTPQDPVASWAAEKAHPQSSHVSLHDRRAMW